MISGSKGRRQDSITPLLGIKRWRKLLLLLIIIHVIFISWLNRFHSGSVKNQNSLTSISKQQHPPFPPSTFQHDFASLEIDGGDDKKKLSCRVLVLNQHAEYHYEVLESIIAMYPIDFSQNCDHSTLHFSVAISTSTQAFLASTREFQQMRSNSWQDYAQQRMMSRSYTFSNNKNSSNDSVEQQTRIVKEILRVPAPKIDMSTKHYPVPTQLGSFHYKIIASCYCTELYKNWVMEKPDQFCLFHGICPQSHLLPRSFWVHPSMGERSMFPKWLPQFDESERVIDKKIHHLCIIGSTKKREYNLVEAFMKHRINQQAGASEASFLIHHFGRGDMPEVMKPYEVMQLHDIQDYLSYQLQLYKVCDAILPLVTTVNHPEYFTSSPVATRMTGSLVQASSYHKLVLMHEDLVPSYGKLLESYITHDDTTASFILGMTQLLNRLSKIKGHLN